MDSDTFWGLSATGWTAITALLTLGLLVMAVVAALYAARQVKIAREQADETRKAQAEASRPYVIVAVEFSQTGPPLFDLVVRNIGQRPAINVSITLDPPPVVVNEVEGHELAKVKMLSEPVAMIAPGQEMRTFYDSHVDRHERDDLPTSHRASLAYRDSSGHEYAETSVLDIDAMKGTLYTDVKTVHDIGKTLAQMLKTFKSASILGRRGNVQVEAAVEPRAEQQQRLAQETAEMMAELERRHARHVGRLLPGGQRPDQPAENVEANAQGAPAVEPQER